MSGPPSGRTSVLTPAGRGAVAVVAAAGLAALKAVDASFTAANGRPLSQQPRDRIVFGHWGAGDRREEVLLLRGEGDSLEIHCHGGAAASARVVAALVAAGCQLEPWQEWLGRAHDFPIAVEADHALTQATTRRTAALLLQQRQGALVHAIRSIQAALEVNDADAARSMLRTLTERSVLGLHLTQPWQVAIAGRPNVGKSSLINALVGFQRAIVFDQPGTTRDVLSADTAIDGWPVRVTDAAGIRATVDPLEAEGVSRAREQLARADLVLWVLDATAIGHLSEPRTIAERELAEEAGGALGRIQPLIVLNKIDLLPSPPIAAHADVVPISALTRLGIGSLLSAIAHRLAPTPPEPGDAMPFTPRQVELLKRALAAVDHADLASARHCLNSLAGSGR
jgi:tRNA modification GTPase